MLDSSISHYNAGLLLQGIEIICTHLDRDEMLNNLCNFIQKNFKITHAIFYGLNLSTSEPLITDHFLFNISFNHFFSFKKYYSQTHPLYKLIKMSNFPPPATNTCYSLNDFYSVTNLRESEYHREWQSNLPVFYEIGARLAFENMVLGDIAFLRPKKFGHYIETEKDFFNRLFPYLARTMYLLALKEGKAGVNREYATIECGAKGEIFDLNHEAQNIFAQRDHPDLIEITANKNIQSYTQGAYEYYVNRISLDWGQTKQIVLLRPHFAIQRILDKLDFFKLTFRQKEITILVIRGFGNKEIAQRLCIQEQTVKDHLQDIFAKLKVRKRNELSAKIFGLNCKPDHLNQLV